MPKLKSLALLIRPELPISAGICVIMGQVLALNHFASLPVTLASFFSIFCLSASILVLNDYFDVETDRINAPHRPIPSGAVSPAEALTFSIVLLTAALAISVLIHVLSFAVTVALFIIGFLYNRRFKKTGLPGNVMVSFSVGMTFLYGGISAGVFYNKIVWLFGAIAALIDLGEEIAADAMDAGGDGIIGSRSLAIRYGRKCALRISGVIFTAVILLSFLPFILNWLPVIYLIPIIIMDIAIALPAYLLMHSEGDSGRAYIRYIYLGSTLGIVIFIVMRLLTA